MSRWWRSHVAGDHGLAAQGVVRTGFLESAILIALTSAGVSGAALGVLVPALVGASVVAASIGLQYLASALFRPKQPKPEDVQNSVKNPTAARQRHYGRVKTSGPWVFGEAKEGRFYKVIALGTGELDAIEEIWGDDNLCSTIDGSGNVKSDPYDYGSDGALRILTRLGTPVQTAFSELTAVFPAWTSEHRGNGVSLLFALQRDVKAEDLSKVFPNLTNTLYRVVARASKVLNPVSGVVAWSDNAAAVIRDYATHPDGARLPAALFNTPLALAGWKQAFNRAAIAVPRKAGGTEPAYRLWGSYTFDERPADVFGRMQQCCDGRFVPTPDGGVTLRIGTWAEPTVVLDEDAIVGFSDLSHGRDILTTANVIAATYMSPTHDYQATDADRWVDEADVSARGEIVSELSFNMSPSHGQTRRLMKKAAYRANPNWTGQFRCNMRGLAAFGEDLVRIRYPLFGIDEVFEVDDFRFDLGEGGILLGCTMTVKSMPQESEAWNPALEEGVEPISENVVVDKTIPLPQHFSFGVDRIVVGGQQVPFGVLTFDAPPSSALVVEARYKKVADSEWIPVPVGDDATEARTNALSDGTQYEAQVRHVTITGRSGNWTASQKVTPIADPTAPGLVSNVTATGGAGVVDLSWKSPNSQNYVGATIRRNTTNTEAGAPIRLEYGPPGTVDSWQDTGLAPGTYYYWIRSANASSVESAPVAAGAVTVT